MPTWKAELLWVTSHYEPGVDNYKGSSSWVQQHASMQASALYPASTQFVNHRCAKFQVIPIRGFSFYHANIHTRTHTKKSWQISAPTYVITDNNLSQVLVEDEPVDIYNILLCIMYNEQSVKSH